MPQLLTDLEIQVVLRLLARIQSAWEIQGSNSWDTPVPQSPELLSNSPKSVYQIIELLRAGAHHLVISQFGDLLANGSEPSPALDMAISALLWGEHDLAEEWAMRELQTMEAQDIHHCFKNGWDYCTVESLKLAKVFRALGKPEEEAKMRRRINEILPRIRMERDPGMIALRLVVELGYEQETDAIARKLPPLIVGHSRGNLTRRLFQVLLAHDKQILAWALFAMTSEDHDEQGLRHAAMEAACEREDFELALKFGTNDGFKKVDEWPHLTTIARWLIAQKRTQDWTVIWKLVTDQQFGLYHRFSTEHRLRFLAEMIEYVQPADRIAMFKISNNWRHGVANIPNQELAQQIADLNLVIAAWGASKPMVRKLVKEAKIPRTLVRTVMRAAVERDLPCLLDLISGPRTKGQIPYDLKSLEIELLRTKRGKPHKLERVFQSMLQKAVASNDQLMLHTIKSFVGRSWGDMERYKDLLKRYPSSMGLSIVDMWPIITPIVKAGNLIALEAELLKVNQAFCLTEANGELLACLKNRFGLTEKLENF